MAMQNYSDNDKKHDISNNDDAPTSHGQNNNNMNNAQQQPLHSSSASTATDSLLRIGKTRIRDAAGYTGTVVYVGKVASAKKSSDQYAGVVWDDCDRGKHDGSVVCIKTGKLVRHFQAPHPTSGSFVRLSKIDAGVALTPDLLKQRYVDQHSRELVAPDNVLPHTAATCSGADNKPIEFYGELQIRRRQQVEDLQQISLRRMGISSFAAADNGSGGTGGSESGTKGWKEFQEQFKDIDLAGNLFCDWHPISQILETFVKLERLSLAANRIGNLSSPLLQQSSQQQQHSHTLTHLNLNQTGITSVQTVLCVGSALPALRELCLSNANLSNLNAVSDGPTLAGAFSNLTFLDCSGCQLSTVTAIQALACLPALQTLSLDDNPLQQIVVVAPTAVSKTKENGDDDDDDDHHHHSYFSRLEQLQLARTDIRNWKVVQDLDKLPRLRALRLRSCPLLKDLGSAEARSSVIARLPGLQTLNGSSITEKERSEAEKRYVTAVTRIALQQNQLGNQKENNAPATSDSPLKLEEQAKQKLSLDHPQYERLAGIYPDTVQRTTALVTGYNTGLSASDGGVAGGRDTGSTSSLLADQVVNVTIRSMAAASCTTGPLIRRLPGGLTVGRLKALLSRHFGLDVDLQVLHFTTPSDDSAFPVELDSDDHTLAYCGVFDGAEILMNERDLKADQRERDKAAAAFINRVEQEERDMMLRQEQQQRCQ